MGFGGARYWEMRFEPMSAGRVSLGCAWTWGGGREEREEEGKGRGG